MYKATFLNLTTWLQWRIFVVWLLPMAFICTGILLSISIHSPSFAVSPHKERAP